MIKCVIFDMDGTLAELLPLITTSFRQSLEPLANRIVSDQEIIDTFGPSEEGSIAKLLPDKYDEACASFHETYQKLHHMCTEPFPGVFSMLDDLKARGVKIALVTGKGKRTAATSSEALGLAPYFDTVYTGSSQGWNKPVSIRRVLEEFGLKPEEALHVGDAPTDVTAAKMTGVPMASAAWSKFASLEKIAAEAPENIFHSVEDLHGYLKKATRAGAAAV